MSRQRQQPSAVPPNFGGMASLANVSPEALSQAFAEWIRNGNRIQAELMRFVSDRFSKDLALISRFAACKAPGDFLALQSQHVADLANDYLQESARIFALTSEVAQDGLHGFTRADAPGKNA